MKINWKGIVGTIGGLGLLGFGIGSLVKKNADSEVEDADYYVCEETEVDDDAESEEE